MMLLILACDTTSLDPQDNRLLQPAQNKLSSTSKLIQRIGGLVGNDDPYIKEIIPRTKTTDGSGAWIYDVVIHKNPNDKIKVYSVFPNGCEKIDVSSAKEVAIIEDQSQSTLNRAINEGDITYKLTVLPGVLLTVEDGTNSGNNQIDLTNNVFSLVCDTEDWKPTRARPNHDLITGRITTLEGTAYPGLCLNLLINDEVIDITDVDINGNWVFADIPLVSGKNQLLVTVVNTVSFKGTGLPVILEYKENIFTDSAEKVPGKDPAIDAIKIGRASDVAGINSNCTWYAAAAVKYWCEQLGLSTDGMPASQQYGAPSGWIKNARDNGFRVDDNPEPGSLIVFEWTGGGSHVGFVENVEIDDTSALITWSEEHYYISTVGSKGVSWGGHATPVPAEISDSSIYRWTQTIRLSRDSKTGMYSCNTCKNIKFIHFFD